MRYKFTKKNDIDKLDPYLKLLLHMLANKPLSENIQSKLILWKRIFLYFLIFLSFYSQNTLDEQVNEKAESSKKKQKKGKKN